MANQAAQTAYGPMSVVAVEQYYPEGQKLVQDEVAFQFLPRGLKALVKLTRWPKIRALLFSLSEKRGNGVWGGVLCRKRYIDERLLEAVSSGISSVVILGAGLDTRAFRLPALAEIPVFEVDLPENSQFKRDRVIQLYGKLPAQVNFIATDFERQELDAVLAAQGYKAGQKTFFILEAVTQYLTEGSVRETFNFLSRAGVGSRLAFTYIRKDFIEGTNLYGVDYLYKAYREKRRLWQYGMDPEQVDAFLRQYGWEEFEQMGSQEFIARYVEPSGRELPVMEIERIVYAGKL